MSNLSPTIQSLVGEMVRVGAVSFRDIGKGEPPFVYSSKNKGPGYIMVKGLVTQPELLDALVYQLAVKVLEQYPDVEYVGANVSGGMVPGRIMAEALTKLTGRRIYYFYVRETRKVGGHEEQIVGDVLNSFFAERRRGLVFEELVNFAETTTNSAEVQRKAGHYVPYGATIVSYDHGRMHKKLADADMRLIALLTVGQILEIAENLVPPHLVADYRSFLRDPTGWQLVHGYELPKKQEAA